MALVTVVLMELAENLAQECGGEEAVVARCMPLQKAILMNSGYPDETCTSDMLLDGSTFISCISSHHFLAMMLQVIIVWEWESAGPDGQLMMKMAALGNVA